MALYKVKFGFVFPVMLGLVFLTGCFSIPFLGQGGPPKHFEPGVIDFDRNNVFVGYDGDERPIVEIRLVKQEVSTDGITIHARIFPTENFKVRNIFRGLRSINYYPIERRFHRLEVKAGRRKVKAKVKDNLQVKDQKPLDAIFAQGGVFALLPDSVSEIDLKFQDVKSWRKMPADSLENWYSIKENYLEELDRRQRRSSLVEQYARRQRQDYTRTFTQYDSLYVTLNNAYVYLDKDVNSDILSVLHAGDKLEYGVSDGLWIEVPLPDSLIRKSGEMLEARRQMNLSRWRAQRQAAQARTRAPVAQAETEIDTTLKITAYMLEAMVQPSYRQAVSWERETMLEPADVPLFAQVLQDREKARIARLDSIAKARTDSIAHIQFVADSLRRALEMPDSLKPDTTAAGAGVAAGAAADSAKAAIPADSLAADTAAGRSQPAASTAGQAPPAVTDSSAPGPGALPPAAVGGAGRNPQVEEGDGTGRNRPDRRGGPPGANRGSGGQSSAAPADSLSQNRPDTSSTTPSSP